jgi:hypothetical protein
MSDEEKKEWHRKFAAEFFNHTWTLLEKEDRTDDETAEMVSAAHASLAHWGKVGTAVHFARGEWQVARVYSVAMRPASALRHAERCLKLTEENELGGFDLAFAYEGMARAFAVAERWQKSGEYLELAGKAGDGIDKEENRTYFLRELGTIPEQTLDD